MSAGSRTKRDKEAEEWLATEPRGAEFKSSRSRRSTGDRTAAEREWLPSSSDPEPVGPPANGSRRPGPLPGKRRLALRLRRIERKLEESERRNEELEQRAAELEERLAEERRKNRAPAARKAKPARAARKARPKKAAPKRLEPKQPEPRVRASKAKRAGAGKLDANKVSFEQLRDLGFTVTQSARLIAYRDARQGYTSAADFDDIPGFSGDARDALRSRLKVGRKAARSKS